MRKKSKSGGQLFGLSDFFSYILYKGKIIIMTQKEVNELSIFSEGSEIFISKMLKNGELSNVRKNLNEVEMMNLLVTLIRNKFIELNSSVLTINMEDKPFIEIKLLADENAQHTNEEAVTEEPKEETVTEEAVTEPTKEKVEKKPSKTSKRKQ